MLCLELAMMSGYGAGRQYRPLAGNLLLYGIGAMAVAWWGPREEHIGQSTEGVIKSGMCRQPG